MSENEADGRVPTGEVLVGAGIDPLEPDWTALEAFVLVK